jgi:deoxyribose-phosphate aldolase
LNIEKYIDHTILKPDATESQIIKLCEEAKTYKFASVCVNSYYTSIVRNALIGTGVKTCVVVGFPLGAVMSEIKAFETRKAIESGAEEIDMVINIGALKDKKYDVVLQDIKSVVDEAEGKAIVKVIIECCLLDDEEIVQASILSMEAGADYVKTSTGFSTGGAEKNDVKLMRMTVGSILGVKASGGIKNFETAILMINSGASRIGTSSGVQIVKESLEQ